VIGVRVSKLASATMSIAVPVLLVSISAVPVGAFPAAVVPAAGAVPAGTPVVRVEPATDLVPGQSIRVAARGLPRNTPVEVVACAGVPDNSETGCPTRLADGIVTDGRGRLSLQTNMPGVAYTDIYGPQPYYCRDDVCGVVVVWRDQDGNIGGTASSEPVVMRGSSATIAVTPADGLTDGRRVRVTGRAEGSDARYVTILQVGCWHRLGESGCDYELPLVSVRLRTDDTFTARVPVVRVLPGGLDCLTDVDDFRECRLTARFLSDSSGGGPDETFGVPLYGHPGRVITFD
jgi:hypothetical protein